MQVMCSDHPRLNTQLIWRSFTLEYPEKTSQHVIRDDYHSFAVSSYHRNIRLNGNTITGEANIVYTDIRIFGLFKALRMGYSLRYNKFYRMLELYNDN